MSEFTAGLVFVTALAGVMVLPWAVPLLLVFGTTGGRVMGVALLLAFVAALAIFAVRAGGAP